MGEYLGKSNDQAGDAACLHPMPSGFERGPAAVAQAQELAAAESSGPGAVIERRVTGMRRVVLANFAIDSAVLKPKHIEWMLNAHLDGSFERARVDITGFASRSGPTPENAALSQRRAEAIRAALRPEQFDPPLVVNITADGETASPAADDTECAVDRSVQILITPLPQDAQGFEAEEVTGRERDGRLRGGFRLRSCPPTWMINERAKTDPLLFSMREWTFRNAVVEASTNMMATANPNGRLTGELAAQGVNATQASMSVTGGQAGTLGIEDTRVRALIVRTWTEYAHRLAEDGLGFDTAYRLIDENGREVDNWWHERIR